MFVDISLRINYTQDGFTCVDQLSVIDNSRSIYNSCLEEVSLQPMMSSSSQVDINLEIKSKKMFPKRGVLLYYKGIGCPTLDPPIDGYLIDRNETIAEYMCNVGYIFHETQSRIFILRCVGGNAWHTELPDCINTTITIYNLNNLTSNEILVLNNHSTDLAAANQHSNTMQKAMQIHEYVIPGLIILALFSVNAVIVYFIHRQRKKNNAHLAEEELAVIS
ncbi:uncharacterized protein LOC123305600 [Chrysoperla carnea]|uniref:uncharacterized protein LOC123305600 n=1 Tax=Chrysoperla carnea TaxID=189513 RepID=UPI001D065160|nr:uncharacterized protein LOC123305600 [Chrysoperla carnea]